MSNREDKMVDLLCVVLDCGYADLNMALDSNYDFDDIWEYAKEFAEKPSINDLIYSILSMGLNDIANYIHENKDVISDSLSDEEREVFESLTFEPHEDIELFVNCIDSHAWFLRDNQELYEKYFPEAIKHFEKMTDISLT